MSLLSLLQLAIVAIRFGQALCISFAGLFTFRGYLLFYALLTCAHEWVQA